MPLPLIRRDDSTGSVEIHTSQCKVLCVRPAPGTVTIQINGKDSGALYKALFNHLEPDLVSEAPIALFIDTRHTSGHAINLVEWAHFLGGDHGLFSRIHVLVGSTLINLSTKIIMHLSRRGDLIQIHTVEATYQRELQSTISSKQAA